MRLVVFQHLINLCPLGSSGRFQFSQNEFSGKTCAQPQHKEVLTAPPFVGPVGGPGGEGEGSVYIIPSTATPPPTYKMLYPQKAPGSPTTTTTSEEPCEEKSGMPPPYIA